MSFLVYRHLLRMLKIFESNLTGTTREVDCRFEPSFLFHVQLTLICYGNRFPRANYNGCCSRIHIQGFILIKKKRLPHNTLGITQRRIFMGNIVAATIYFDSGSYRITNVFEHEIGHALGYNHVEEEGHIMHPLWEKMSPKFWIPE